MTCNFKVLECNDAMALQQPSSILAIDLLWAWARLWQSMQQGCHRSAAGLHGDMNIHDEESAADLQQTIRHAERVCGKVAASLRQN